MFNSTLEAIKNFLNSFRKVHLKETLKRCSAIYIIHITTDNKKNSGFFLDFPHGC